MGDPVKCDKEGCTATVATHMWGRIRAGSPKEGEGWFFSVDGEIVRCPEHLPDWVPIWRARQREKRDGGA